jgi:acetyl esterase/lipase
VLLASGCTSVTLAIANAPALFGKYSVRHDIAYGEGPARRLDVYQPEGLATNRPVVVFLHGGGWVDGTKNQYRFVADALTKRGYVFIAVNYRLYPEAGFPGFVQDGAQAVQWAHTHAGEFGGDASRLYLMGHSAGAQIAALLAFDERYLRAVGGERAWVKGFIGLAGPYDFLPLKDPELEKIFGPASQYPASQPINFVDGAEPPALLLHGLSDNTVWPRNSQHLAAKIRERGGSVEERYYEGVSHGGILAGLSVYFRNRRPVLEDIAKFVDEPPAKTGSGPSASLRPSSP